MAIQSMVGCTGAVELPTGRPESNLQFDTRLNSGDTTIESGLFEQGRTVVLSANNVNTPSFQGVFVELKSFLIDEQLIPDLFTDPITLQLLVSEESLESDQADPNAFSGAIMSPAGFDCTCECDDVSQFGYPLLSRIEVICQGDRVGTIINGSIDLRRLEDRLIGSMSISFGGDQLSPSGNRERLDVSVNIPVPLTFGSVNGVRGN